MSSFVQIRDGCACPFTQQRYLSLTSNKVSFIKYLSDALTKSGCKVINCRGEADAQVAKSAITFAKRKIGSCVVVADDSDIAIMLLYH